MFNILNIHAIKHLLALAIIAVFVNLIIPGFNAPLPEAANDLNIAIACVAKERL